MQEMFRIKHSEAYAGIAVASLSSRLDDLERNVRNLAELRDEIRTRLFGAEPGTLSEVKPTTGLFQTMDGTIARVQDEIEVTLQFLRRINERL